ncbi:uncharacterized protein LOC110738236 [Chenopodium quinoa]|uniref:uncharacterized protein LOC110738236 n=1 Tax=Chenopodium quinoa TaxID=63459 RepID=UPI000B78A092|nr:uncharacterized protein LOC110738236 [Chenopodium quinoa]
MILEALDAIDEFINPHRSTLNETQISTNNDVCLSIDQVTADLDALQWHDFNDDDDNDDDNEGGNMEIVEYKRKRKEFNPVHLKKPRSKIKTHKRNNISRRDQDRKAWGACWSSPRVHKRSGVWSQEIKFEDGIHTWPSSLSKTLAYGNWTQPDECN